jgi:hypothetical protein
VFRPETLNKLTTDVSRQLESSFEVSPEQLRTVPSIVAEMKLKQFFVRRMLVDAVAGLLPANDPHSGRGVDPKPRGTDAVNVLEKMRRWVEVTMVLTPKGWKVEEYHPLQNQD